MTTTVRRSDSIAALSEALAAAQSEMKNPAKDSVNPHFKSKYADLATVRDAVMPVLNRNGLAVLQLPCEVDGEPALTSVLLHKSGEWYETTLALRAQQNTPQGIGSALTYCRRYALQSLAGVAAEEDDDGNATGHGSARPQQQPPPAKTSTPKAANVPATPAPGTSTAATGGVVAGGHAPAPKGDGIDRSAQEAAKLNAARILGNPLNDSAAILALLARKGWDWAGLIKSLNDKFKATYSLTRTPWGDVAEGHRKSTIDALNKLPDKDSAGDLTRLVGALAKHEGAEFAAVFQRYAVAACLPEACIAPDDLTASQLVVACKAFRAKLAAVEAAGEGGAA